MVRITELDEQHLHAYSCCMEEYDERMVKGGERKKAWIREMQPLGLRSKVAVDDDDRPIGMIEYMPIEVAPALGEELYFINCIWVHGHKGGVGNRQKQGVGKTLLVAAEQDAMELGAKGMAAWGLVLPFWMRSAWYRRHGYRNADRQGIMGLVWKPFHSDAAKPAWIMGKPEPFTSTGKLTITTYLNGQCPLMNYRFEQLNRIVQEFGDNVEFRTISTMEKADMIEHRAKDAFFLGTKAMSPGPPLPDDKLRKKIHKAIRRAGVHQ